MNNPRDAHNRLLADTLQGDWTEGPAVVMAQRAAKHARQRRTRHRAVAVCALLAAAIALTRSLPRARTESPATLARISAPGYEIISDDELQMLLSNRPLLVLPLENRTPKIVFLER